MQGLEVPFRSSGVEDFGLYPTYRVEQLKAFLYKALLRSLFQEDSFG